MISLTRRYHFPASHRLHSPRLSDSENARLYGKCNNPFGHGHDYTLELTIAGELDVGSGLLLPLRALDAFVQEKILTSLRLPQHQCRCAAICEFGADYRKCRTGDRRFGAPPLGRVVRRSAVHVSRVQIQETERNGFELLLAAPEIENSSARAERKCDGSCLEVNRAARNSKTPGKLIEMSPKMDSDSIAAHMERVITPIGRRPHARRPC